MTGLDALYIPVAVLTAPWWALRKKRVGWRERFGAGPTLPAPQAQRPRLLLHAVSVGEVAALRTLVPLLTPHADVVVSASTDTGLARAQELFRERCEVVRFPLDFSWSVRRFLDRVRPDAVALTELEVWPQFVRACELRSVPVAVINGRLSPRSFRGYQRIRPFFSRVLQRLAFAAVQDADYAARFEALGLPPQKVLLTGSMKWDNAQPLTPDEHARALALRDALGIDPARPLVVGGSTAQGEEALLRDAMPEGVQLLCAPRQKERFDAAAGELPGCVRRSARTPASAGARFFLLDSFGELRLAYALADVVVVGRSFGALYGSDPAEPAGLGKPTLIGPAHADFAQMVRALAGSGGVKVVSPEHLRAELGALLRDPQARAAMGAAAGACVASQRGASERHAQLLRALCARSGARAGAAALPVRNPIGSSA